MIHAGFLKVMLDVVSFLILSKLFTIVSNLVFVTSYAVS